MQENKPSASDIPRGPYSRRQFLQRSCAAVAALELSLSFACGDDKAPSENQPPLRSHAPPLQQLEKMLQARIMARPQGRIISEHIFASSQLENIFLIDLGRHSVLIDTGFDHQVDHHLDNLEALGCDLSKVVAILGTHSHVDHTGGLKKARDRLDVPVITHPHAVKPVSTGDLLQTAAVIPEVKGWEFAFPACPIDETVGHGDVIQVGDEQIQILHIPGHTPDSLGYVWNGHFFTGDAVFGGGLIGWAHDRWLSNYADHAETMLDLLQSKPDAETFYCAHGPVLPYSTTVPEACLTTLKRLLARENDPCNETPRVKRRPADEPTRVLKLPLA